MRDTQVAFIKESKIRKETIRKICKFDKFD